MMWAPSVPAPMIQAPPILLLSGMPSEVAVAPGTEMVTCRRELAMSVPLRRRCRECVVEVTSGGLCQQHAAGQCQRANAYKKYSFHDLTSRSEGSSKHTSS